MTPNLPLGWANATLENLLASEPRAITDGPFGSNLTTSHYTDKGARVIRLQNIGDGVFNDDRAYISLDHFERLKVHAARAGDLVVASLGDEPPRACIIPELGIPAVVKADCIRVRVHPDLEAKWVQYALNAPQTRRYARARIRGVGRPRLGMSEIRRIPVSIPPIMEQRRIVAALDDHLSRLDAAQQQLDVILKRIEQFRNQVLIAVTGGGWRGNGYAGPAPPSLASAAVVDGELPKIPADWQWTRLAEIADVVGGVTKDSKRQSDPELPEHPYLRVANVQRGRLDLTNVTRIRVPHTKAKQLLLMDGDVLLNEGGDRDKLGRGWIWEGQIEGCIHQNHVFRARVRDGILHPKLLAWHANGFGKRWCEMNGTQSVNLASISLSKIKLMPVPVPPLDQQTSLVETAETYLSILDRCKQQAADARKKSRRLRRSLLSQAFSGRLVPQEPGDEPASLLLERIRRERAAVPKARRGRRTGSVSQEEALL